MKVLQLYINLPPKVIDYQKALSTDLQRKFNLAININKKLSLMQIPILDKFTENTSQILTDFLLKSPSIKLKIESPNQSDFVSRTDTSIGLSLSEKSWNKVVTLQFSLLDLIQNHIDTSNPIILKKESHYNDTPKMYISKYGTDNVLKWFSGGITFADVEDYDKRREILTFIEKFHPAELALEETVMFRFNLPQ